MFPQPHPHPLPVVAYQGEPGAFGEAAIRRHFVEGAHPLPCADFPDVASALVNGRAELGVLPVENSGAGPVRAALDVLSSSPLEEIGRIVLPLRQMLVVLPGARLEELREVRSHPIALAQCSRFLGAHPHLVPVATLDTAGAAREVAEGGNPRVGAIASELAAQAWGLDVLRPDVHDDPDNRTTFVVVRKAENLGAAR